MSINSYYSTTAGSNTNAAPNGAPEGWTLSSINDTVRQVMADIRTLCAADTIAAAGTTDLASKDNTFLTLTSTVPVGITSLGTTGVSGIYKVVIYDRAHSITHNATSLILTGGDSRTVAAGDISLFLCEGSGNWRELFFSQAAAATYQPLDATLTALAGLATGASKVPYSTGSDTFGQLTLDTDGTLAANSDTTLATQKATKTYADTKATAGAIGSSGLTQSTARLLGRTTAGTGAPEEITVGTGLTLSAGNLSVTTTGLTAGTPVTLSSTGAFTGIPSTAKRIMVMINAASTTVGGSITLQIGDSGGIEVSGYTGCQSDGSTVTPFSSSFLLYGDTRSGDSYHCCAELILMDGTTWACTILGGGATTSLSGSVTFGNGMKTLTGTLDRLTIGGSFDGGTANILYQ